MRQDLATTASFDLRPIDRSTLCDYERWAQDFFTNPAVIHDPYLDITLQLDVTDARRAYEAQAAGSFTAFLYFHLIQALRGHPEFFYRRVDGQWLRIANPPLFFPIARGTKHDRFYEAYIPDVLRVSWREFAELYRMEVEQSKSSPKLLPTGCFVYSLFIGNLPNLHFTGLSLHVNDRSSGQPFFYFGKRYRSEGQLMASLCIKFHHSTVDPYIIDLLVRDFQDQFAHGQE